jgi:hypothetical protein
MIQRPQLPLFARYLLESGIPQEWGVSVYLGNYVIYVRRT